MYNPNEPRDAEGKWTSFEASAAIREAASDKKPFEAAKSIQEAEDYARKNLIRPERLAYVARNNADPRYQKIVDVSYRGMSLDAANKINERITREIEETGMPLLDKIHARPIKKQGWAARMSDSGYLELNTSVFKDLNRMPEKETLEEFIKVRPQLEALKNQGRLSAQQINMLKRSDEILKFKSTSASEDAIDIVTHEMGHHLDNNIKSIAIKRGIDEKRISEMIQQAMKDSNIPENKYNLSYYAFSDIFHQRAEVFAEAYTIYRQKKLNRLSPSFIDLFNLITK